MKKIIVIIALASVLLVSSAPLQVPTGPTPAFASAVESYIAVQFMVTQHMPTDALAFRILHALTVWDYSTNDVYYFIWQETGGNPPDILRPYYGL